jgi:hypothetical protein
MPKTYFKPLHPLQIYHNHLKNQYQGTKTSKRFAQLADCIVPDETHWTAPHVLYSGFSVSSEEHSERTVL